MQDNKTYYLYAKDQKVNVSEEIYRAYVRPMRKQKMREYRRKNELDISIVSFDELSEQGVETEELSQNFLEEIIDKEEDTELNKQLKYGLSQLKGSKRIVVEMVCFGNKSQVEVAEKLGISPQMVNYFFKRAIEQLKIFLKKF